MKKKFYITSPIFYPNARPHLGHAYTATLCDIFARYHREQGDAVHFLTGTDENTGKVVKAAAAAGKDLPAFLDEINANFTALYKNLGISYDQFIRTTDQKQHWPGAQKMWQKLVDAGDIYKHEYEGLYCRECEAFYTEKDLVDGKCPLHGIVVEKIKEQNYFFKLSKYTEPIKKAIGAGELVIVPPTRRNEILALLERGLEDVSFSRPKSVVPHGIPVPGDPEQVIYVWCDALVNYISALGYGGDEKLFKKFWPADMHIIGKDIIRFHAAIWPAMLLSAGLPLPKSIFVHGFILSGGKKMSKSLGNVIDPADLIAEYGAEALRYYFAREISPFEDGEISTETFKTAYNANLANGLGNLVSRVMKMATANGIVFDPKEMGDTHEKITKRYQKVLDEYNIKAAADIIWEVVTGADQSIQRNQPFKKIKEDRAGAEKDIQFLLHDLKLISELLKPIMPETARKIEACVLENKMPAEALFLRKQ